MVIHRKNLPVTNADHIRTWWHPLNNTAKTQYAAGLSASEILPKNCQYEHIICKKYLSKYVFYC